MDAWRALFPAKLPAIVPVVLYHGSTRWAAPTEFGSMIDLDPLAMAHLGVHLPQFHLLLDDLSGVDDASRLARSLTAEAVAALMLLARARVTPA